MPQPFNIAHIEPSSFIYGPGERFVIWVQGCTLGCQGCWNRTMLSKRPKQLIAREALLQKILDLDSIQGVTLLGGEPLQQLSYYNKSNQRVWIPWCLRVMNGQK